MPKFHPHQSIVAKILSIDYENKLIQVTAKLSEVYDKNIEVNLLALVLLII